MLPSRSGPCHRQPKGRTADPFFLPPCSSAKCVRMHDRTVWLSHEMPDTWQSCILRSIRTLLVISRSDYLDGSPKLLPSALEWGGCWDFCQFEDCLGRFHLLISHGIRVICDESEAPVANRRRFYSLPTFFLLDLVGETSNTLYSIHLPLLTLSVFWVPQCRCFNCKILVVS